MIRWVDRVLDEWGVATERMLVQSPLGYRNRTTTAAVADGHVPGSHTPGTICPTDILPKHLRKIDRLVRIQPKEFQALAEARYIEGCTMRELAKRCHCNPGTIHQKLAILAHRLDACWGWLG